MQNLSKDSFKRFNLIKHLIKKYPYKNININNIQKIKNSYQEIQPFYEIINSPLEIDGSQFIDNQLLDEMKTFNQYIKISEPLINIKISYKELPSKKLINIIYSTVKLFQKLYGNKNIIISIALTNQKRILTTPIIGTLNVNGGQTNFKTIEIFRKEEVIKVLMHELCHFYKIDCDTIDKNKELITDRFNIKTPDFLLLQEAFTECLAMNHHIALISYYTNKHINIIYHYEKIFSLYQVCKILNHYKFKKFEDFFKKEMKQETNVFSYYIIKFFMLYSMDNKCCIHNLNQLLDNKEIINIINENINQKFDDNLRLTFFELDF